MLLRDLAEGVALAHFVVLRGAGGLRLLVRHSVVGIHIEIVPLQRQHRVAERTVVEIDHTLGIEGLAHIPRLEMEMRAGAAAGAAAQTDRLARRNQIVLMDQMLRQMPVIRLQTVGMTHHDEIAVAAGSLAAADITHDAVKRRTDRIAHAKRHVDAVVGTPLAVLERGTATADDGRHETVRRIDQQQVDGLGQIGHLHVAIGVDGLDVPVVEQAGGIDVGTLQLDVVPGVVVEENDLDILVVGVHGIDRADKHQRGVGIVVKLLQIREISTCGIGLLRPCRA